MYLRDGSARTIERSARLRQKLQNKLAISSSRIALALGQTSASATEKQAPGTAATGEPTFKCLR